MMKNVKAADLDAVPPPPLSSPTAQNTTCDLLHEQIDGTEEPTNKTSTSVEMQIDSTINTDQTESPIINKPGLANPSSPHKTPASITRYIQIAQDELDQLNIKHSSSPRTPLHNIASPDLMEYIRSTEKELDTILKDALTSPTNSKRNDSMEISLDESFDELKDLSFQEEMGSNESKSRVEDIIDSIESEQNQSKQERHPEPVVIKSKKVLHEKRARFASNHHSKEKAHTRKRKVGHTNKQPTELAPFLIKAFLLSCFVATSLAVLLGSIYPASSLLGSSNTETCNSINIQGQCTATYQSSYSVIQRFQLGLAAISFGFATCIRTIIAAPLQRLDDKLRSKKIYVQIVSEILHLHNILADIMEECSYDVWENTAMYHQVLKVGSRRSSFQQPPELDLSIQVPCDVGRARVYLLSRHDDVLPELNDRGCQLRDVISIELLMQYAAKNFDPTFDLATHPIVLRNLWSKESLSGNERRLTPEGILRDPQLSSFILPNYFSDATKTGYDALVPDSDRISLSQFVRNIQTGQTPYAKIGTQSIVEEFPELREEIVPFRIAKSLFGWDPLLDDLRAIALDHVWPIFKPFVRIVPPSTYYPIFIAGMSRSHKADSHSRTDLHTEPIGNIAVQLHGSRSWTLVPTKWSGLLRPTVSKHGRGKCTMSIRLPTASRLYQHKTTSNALGYIYSNLDPITQLPLRLKELPLVWTCETNKGDGLWV
jgi:uncharacterized membrane protein